MDENSVRAANWRRWALQVRERAVERLLSVEFREVLSEEREFVMGWEAYGLWRCRRLRRSERAKVVEQTGLAEGEWRVDRWRDMVGGSDELRQWQEQWSEQYDGLADVACRDGRVRKVVEEAVRAHERHRTWATTVVMYAVAWNMGLRIASLVSPVGAGGAESGARRVMDGMVWLEPGMRGRGGMLDAGRVISLTGRVLNAEGVPESGGERIARERRAGRSVLVLVHSNNNHCDPVVCR